MREIKFRGKRIDNNKWVFGDLVKIQTRHGSGFGMRNTPEHINDGVVSLIAEKVDPETVGQFTGLKDKNGQEIYEGDIVREHGNDYTPIYQNGIYMAYNVDKINDPYVSTQFNVIWRNGCEVIGNVHENPELLEVDTDD